MDIDKERSAANTSPTTSTVRVVVVNKFNSFLENHPFACDGVGWFSCFLVCFPERNMHPFHAQFPSKLHEEIQEMFP